MIKTVEAVIDEKGHVQLLEPISLPAARRAIVTILEEEPATIVSETALLSEQALADDWNKSEEDKAWSHLQQAQWPLCRFLFPIYRQHGIAFTGFGASRLDSYQR